MTAAKPMGTLRRRAMPGMPQPPVAAPAPNQREATVSTRATASAAGPKDRTRVVRPAASRRQPVKRGHHVEDYSDTHLANFRLPVDLHARYGRLVAETQQQHPRLRKTSLTEVWSSPA